MNGAFRFSLRLTLMAFHDRFVSPGCLPSLAIPARPGDLRLPETNQPRFFFSSPSRVVSATELGEPMPGSCGSHEELAARVEAALIERAGETAQQARLVGVVPFDSEHPAHLFIPRACDAVDMPTFALPSVPQARLQPSRVEAPPSADELVYCRLVEDAVAAVNAGQLRKVVLARTQDFLLKRPPRLPALLSALREQEPGAFLFAVAGARGGTLRTLVGASPELLVQKHDREVSSRPLAGSAQRARDPARDREIASALLRSRKDRHEHQLVVERVVDDLRPLLLDVKHELEPELVATSSMWHLATTIRGQLRDRSVSSLRLALALHPTPAVCGTPTDAARSFIAAHEPFARGNFTGVIGHMDADGDGEWVVALRCAELEGANARLFAGAGIVAGSDPHAELLETRGKMQTMLQVLLAATEQGEP